MLLKINLKSMIQLATVLICYMLILTFQSLNYRINLASPIFPAWEIMVVYHLCVRYKLWHLYIFFLGFLFDHLYGMQFGTNSTIFLMVNLLFRHVMTKSLAENYTLNCRIFCFYCIFVLYSRYILNSGLGISLNQYIVISLQLVVTICCYNLLRFFGLYSLK